MLFCVEVDPGKCPRYVVPCELRRSYAVEENRKDYQQWKGQGNRREQSFGERALLAFCPPQIPERDRSAADGERKDKHCGNPAYEPNDVHDLTSNADGLRRLTCRHLSREHNWVVHLACSTPQPYGSVRGFRRRVALSQETSGVLAVSDHQAPRRGLIPRPGLQFPAVAVRSPPQRGFSRSPFICV